MSDIWEDVQRLEKLGSDVNELCEHFLSKNDELDAFLTRFWAIVGEEASFSAAKEWIETSKEANLETIQRILRFRDLASRCSDDVRKAIG